MDPAADPWLKILQSMRAALADEISNPKRAPPNSVWFCDLPIEERIMLYFMADEPTFYSSLHLGTERRYSDQMNAFLRGYYGPDRTPWEWKLQYFPARMRRRAELRANGHPTSCIPLYTRDQRRVVYEDPKSWPATPPAKAHEDKRIVKQPGRNAATATVSVSSIMLLDTPPRSRTLSNHSPVSIQSPGFNREMQSPDPIVRAGQRSVFTSRHVASDIHQIVSTDSEMTCSTVHTAADADPPVITGTPFNASQFTNFALQYLAERHPSHVRILEVLTQCRMLMSRVVWENYLLTSNFTRHIDNEGDCFYLLDINSSIRDFPQLDALKLAQERSDLKRRILAFYQSSPSKMIKASNLARSMRTTLEEIERLPICYPEEFEMRQSEFLHYLSSE